MNYAPHKNQKIFHQKKQKYRAYVGGIGSGKTMAGCAETIKFIIENPGCLFVIAAPTYPMLRDATLRTFFDLCPRELIENYNSTENIIKFVNGSEVLCRSCEDVRNIERLRGTNLAGFWIDESALVPHMAWKVLIGRLRQSDMNLSAWITTSPKGFNWVYTEFAEKEREEYVLIPCSSRDNPYLTKGYIRDLEQSYVGVFARQEIEGEFVGFEGAVYSSFSRKIHIGEKTIPDMKYFVAGVDWGYTNPSVILVVGIDKQERAWIFEEFYRVNVLVEPELVEVAKQLNSKYNIIQFYCDPSSPEHIQQFLNAGLNAKEGNNSVFAGINAVSSQLQIVGGEPLLHINQTCVHTISEFENYRYPEGKEEKPLQENPLKLYDHAMDALRYVCMGLVEGRFGEYQPFIV